MLARVLEQAGLATVGLTLVRLHTEKVRPPRYLFVPFPFGRALGKPNDPAFQQQVIDAAMALFSLPESARPILADFPVILDEEPDSEEVLACSLVLPPRKSQAHAGDNQALKMEVEAEIAALRPFYEQGFQQLGHTMLGPSHLSAENIEQAARYLADFLNGDTINPPEKPTDVSQVQYLRWCVDDLKVFYLEAAVARQNGQTWTNRQLQDWLWKQTALGNLILAVRRRMEASGNPQEAATAFGLVPRGY